MPVNEFEKQVQQKMDELKFPPSPEVWTEVEKSIRKEKKRRIIIFWWLLPLLLAGGATFFYFDQGENDKVVAMEPSQPGTPQAGTEMNDQSNNSSSPGNNSLSNSSQTNHSEKGNDNNIQGTNSSPDIISSQLNIVTRPGSTRKKTRKQQAEPLQQFNPTGSGVESTKNSIEEKTVIAPQTESSVETKVESVENETATRELKSADTLVKLPETQRVQAPASPGKKKISKPWNWGFAFEAGSSSTHWGPLVGGANSSYDANQYSTPSAGSGTSAPIYIEAPSPALSLGLSAFAEKDLSARFTLRAAVQYNYYSTTMKTGSRIDSSGQIFNAVSDGAYFSNFYRNPSQSASSAMQDYTNKYHLLGVSATIGWKIINGKKFNLSWENGIGYSRLLSSNALHFDQRIRGYYQDFEPFQKSQFFYTMGFSAPIINHSRFRATLNPFMSYGLSPVLKRNNGPTSHFLNFGVGLRFSALR